MGGVVPSAHCLASSANLLSHRHSTSQYSALISISTYHSICIHSPIHQMLFSSVYLQVVVKKHEEGVGGSKPDQNLSSNDSIIRELSRALDARRRVMYSDDDDDNDDDDDDDDEWN